MDLSDLTPVAKWRQIEHLPKATTKVFEDSEGNEYISVNGEPPFFHRSAAELAHLKARSE